MRHTLTIARLTILIVVRQGTLWGLFGLVTGVAILIFFLSVGDEVLVNELQLRIHYSYALAYSLLTLMIIALSCFIVRSEIDGHQVHLLTSCPITRQEIWLGKWVGLSAIAVVAECILIAVITGCSFLYPRAYAVDDVAAAKAFFQVIRVESGPLQPSLQALTEERITGLIHDNRLDPADLDEETWQANFDEVRKKDQLVPKGDAKTWTFDLKRKPSRGDYLGLVYRLYADDRWAPVTGSWRLVTAGSPEAFIREFEVYPYVFNTVEIPISQVPESGRFEITLTNLGDRDVIVPRTAGLRVFYEDGRLVYNIVKAFCAQTVHLLVTVAVGLMAGVAFTFSVAAFLSMVLFLLSVSAGMFTTVVAELTGGHHVAAWERLSVLVINSGMWLAKGLQPPEVIGRVSSGVSIPVTELAVSWLPAVVLYGVVTSVIGIILLRSKELDKIV